MFCQIHVFKSSLKYPVCSANMWLPSSHMKPVLYVLPAHVISVDSTCDTTKHIRISDPVRQPYVQQHRNDMNTLEKMDV